MSSTLKRITRRSALGVLGIGIPSTIWAAVEPRTLSITRRDLTLQNLPPALDGFRLAHLTDLHFQPDRDEGLMEKVRERLKEEDPDLVVLTGDYITETSKTLKATFDELDGISGKQGVIASPGNHDRWHASTNFLKKVIEKKGFTFLRNEGTHLHIKGEQIFVNGLDSLWGGIPDVGRAWKARRKDQPVISLVHEPDFFDDLRQHHQIDLQLSGHTHGGQCRVPLIGYAPVKVKYGRKYIYGDFQRDHSRLWVSRGLGTVGIPVRFACPPELAILTLRARS